MPSDPKVVTVTVEIPQAKLLRAYSLALDAHRGVQRRGQVQVTCMACYRPWPCPAQAAAEALAADSPERGRA